MSQLEPEGRPPELGYAKAEPPKTARLLMGIFGGIFGYLGLVVVTALIYGQLTDLMDPPWWVDVGILAVVPLGLMAGAAVLLKSRAMMISVWITFGVVALSCGTCFALTIR